MTQEQQRRACTELARAIYPAAEVYMYDGECHVLIAADRKPTDTWEEDDTVKLSQFNPFTSVADSRALLIWLAEDDGRWYRYFLALEKSVDTPRERMGQSHPQGLFYAVLRSFVTADLPIIAEAAWRAIAAERSTDS